MGETLKAWLIVLLCLGIVAAIMLAFPYYLNYFDRVRLQGSFQIQQMELEEAARRSLRYTSPP